MQIYIKVIPITGGTSQQAGDSLMMPCPQDMEPDTVLSFLSQRFGEPIETAWTSTARHQRLATGWIFPGTNATAHDPEIELLCVPHIRTGNGTLQNMFELQADQRHEFEQLATDGALDSLAILNAPHRTYQAAVPRNGAESKARKSEYAEHLAPDLPAGR